MIYKYELACREAGLSEEKIKEIRKVFFEDRQRLKREKQKMYKNYIRYFSADAYEEDDELSGYDISDLAIDVEKTVIERETMKRLREVVFSLPEDEREFLKVCYEEAKGSDTKCAEILGIPRQTIQYKKKCLINKIRKVF